MQTDSSLPEPGFIFHTYFTPTHFLHRVHMNPANPIDSAVVHPPRLLVALWCYRQLKKTEKKTGACVKGVRAVYKPVTNPLWACRLCLFCRHECVCQLCVCVCVWVCVCVCVFNLFSLHSSLPSLSFPPSLFLSPSSLAVSACRHVCLCVRVCVRLNVCVCVCVFNHCAQYCQI